MSVADPCPVPFMSAKTCDLLGRMGATVGAARMPLPDALIRGLLGLKEFNHVA